MVMHKDELTALAGVREAILADAREDFSVISEMTEWHEELVEAWNHFAENSVHAEPITDADIEAGFEDSDDEDDGF